MSLFTSTTMDSTSSTSNEEPPAKKYRYTSERHPFRIFESFDFDDLDDDNDSDAEEGDAGSPVKDEVGHRHFAEVSRISKFTSERRWPARKARRDEHYQQRQQQARNATATVPRAVSITSMDDEDIADDNQEQQQHNDATVSTTTAASSTATTTASIPRNVSLQLFELTMSDAATRSTANTTTKNNGNGTKTNNASLPSLAHSSASSAATHLYGMMDEDMMILEEE